MREDQTLVPAGKLQNTSAAHPASVKSVIYLPMLYMLASSSASRASIPILCQTDSHRAAYHVMRICRESFVRGKTSAFLASLLPTNLTRSTSTARLTRHYQRILHPHEISYHRTLVPVKSQLGQVHTLLLAWRKYIQILRLFQVSYISSH